MRHLRLTIFEAEQVQGSLFPQKTLYYSTLCGCYYFDTINRNKINK